MGLRINHNISALEALRQLSDVDRKQSRSLERLSTGLRINRASDDPSGLVISEQLRAQTASLQAAVRNTQTDINLINTAEAALNEVNSLLVGIREAIIFAMDTSHDASEVDAKQRSVDRAIGSIDRIAVTTRFGNRQLLNGGSDFQVTDKDAYIDDLKVRSVRFGNNQTAVTFNVKITDLASRAIIKIAGPGAGTDIKSNTGRLSSATAVVGLATGATSGTGEVVTLRITGTLGSEDITLASGATIRDMLTAVNAVTNATGVFASGVNAASTPGGVPITGVAGFSFALYSVGFGASERITVENLTASGGSVVLQDVFLNSTGTAYNVGAVAQGYFASDTGDDIEARLDGAQVVAKGNLLRVTSNFLDAEVRVSERVYAIASNAATQGITGSLVTSGLAFTVHNNRNSGLVFQMNSEATSIDRVHIGVQSMRSSELGGAVERENTDVTAASNLTAQTGGFLASLRSGSGNDLFQNTANALAIVDEAIAEVSDVRSFLGSIQSFTLEPALSSLGVAIQNITATESLIRDLDFAGETTEFTRNQILFQAATSVLASANLIPQAVLSLLQ